MPPIPAHTRHDRPGVALLLLIGAFLLIGFACLIRR